MPVFKQALTQAIMLKRQRIQAEAMSALDAKTNEMLIRNAQNTAEQAKMTARLASGSSIKIETLEKTWQTIVSGIDETRQIQENAPPVFACEGNGGGVHDAERTLPASHLTQGRLLRTGVADCETRLRAGLAMTPFIKSAVQFRAAG